MFSASPEAKLKVTDSNQTGRSVDDGIVYTCSYGAKFFYYGGKPGELAIYLDADSAQVETTLIKNLTQIIVTYLPATDANPPKVAISTTGEGGWINLTPTNFLSTAKIYNVPSVGDYYIRIRRNGTTNTYIKAVEYCRLDLSACPNCFIYRPE